MKNLKNQKILVTGGSGFIPSHLCRRLVREGCRVSVLTKYNSIIDNIRIADIWNDIEIIEADIRNADSLKKIKRARPHIIYHFAAYNHVGDSFTNVSEAIDVNSKGSVNVLDAYEDYEKFIYISSSEIYGFQKKVPFSEEMNPFPISPYAVGKYSGELYARMKSHVYKRPVVVLRPFNTFGPFQSPRAIIAELIMACIRGDDLVTTEGAQTREFNYIENVVDAFMLAAVKKGAVGQIINIGSGREIRIVDLVKKIHALTGSSSRLNIGKLDYRPTEIWRMFAGNKKAGDILGWSPKIGLEEGLSATIDWYKQFIDVFDDPSSAFRKLCR